MSSSTATTSLPQAAPKLPTQQFRIQSRVLGFDDTAGNGPMVICTPGMGELRQEYRYLTPYLTAAGYRVVTMDVRGHGDSSAQWDDYSAHAVGSDILALMTHLSQQKAVIIGNSFTCGSAMWAARDAPDRVTQVVMIGPFVRDPPGGVPWYMRAILWAGFAGPWRTGFWMTYWDSLFPTKKPADFAQALGANLREPGRMNALKAMLDLAKGNGSETMKNTGMPVLVVMGSKDPDFPDPAVEAQWIVDQTGGQRVMVEGAGHYPQTEMPEQVGPAVVKFLQSK